MKLSPAELLEYQPNRYPFLMLDIVEDFSPGKFARGYKNLTWNEWYFPQHFPGNPNLPGVLQLEAMAQLLTVAITTLPGMKGKITHALSHKVSFHREVLPGDRLELEATVIEWKRGIAKGSAIGKVNNNLACKAEMVITVPDIFKEFLPNSNVHE
jgi:3-hydroxyacyl-[acyl-carrier-protein] dehydratase